MKIWIVDAFTHKPFAGNPAAVTIVEEFPSDIQCQMIAAEMNLSETTYQASKRGGEIKLSIHNDRVHLTGHAVTVLSGKLIPTFDEIFR